MEYGDVHRMFLQGMMSHTMLAEKEALTLFSNIYEVVHGEQCPSLKEMGKAIRLINDHISHMNMKVKLVMCELTGDPFCVLVNTVKSNIPSKVPRHAKAASQLEKEFLKAVLHAIIMSPNGSISSVDCINLNDTLPTVRITRSDADKLLQKMIEKKWFVEKSSMVSLSVRCIAEMEPYIRHVMGDVNINCKLCRTMILQGKSCVHCMSKFHQHCLAKYFKRQPQPKCPECRGEWVEESPDDDMCLDDEVIAEDD